MNKEMKKLIETYESKIDYYEVLIKHAQMSLGDAKKGGHTSMMATCNQDIKAFKLAKQLCIQFVEDIKSFHKNFC